MCDFDRIESLFDGTLPPEECNEVRRHMENCPACRRWYAALEELHREVAAPAGLTERVMEQVRVTPQERRKVPRRWMPMAVAAACVMLVVGLGVGAGYRADMPEAVTMSREAQSEQKMEPYGGAAEATYHCQTDSGEVDGVLTREQTEAVRIWLTAQARAAEETEAAGAPVYVLTAAEVAALNEAVPGLAMPVVEIQLTLPN